MDEPLEIGKIVNTHGLKGEIKVTPWCDDNNIFSKLGTITIEDKIFAVDNVKYYKNSVILKLKGIDSIEAAEKMLNKILFANRSQLGALPQNTYYVKDLLGIEVYTGGKKLGILDDWFPTGSNDIYIVRTEEGKQILLPAIKQVVKKVDLESGRMDVELLEGIVNEN